MRWISGSSGCILQRSGTSINSVNTTKLLSLNFSLSVVKNTLCVALSLLLLLLLILLINYGGG